MEEYILLDRVYFLVNLKTCRARVLNWAIRENICPVELAQYGIFRIGPALLGVYYPVLPSWELCCGSSKNSPEGAATAAITAYTATAAEDQLLGN